MQLLTRRARGLLVLLDRVWAVNHLVELVMRPGEPPGLTLSTTDAVEARVRIVFAMVLVRAGRLFARVCLR